jgi:hypothetical protein
MTDIVGLEKRRNRLIRQQAQGIAKVSYQTSIPVRDRVIQTLDVGVAPLATRLLAEIAKAGLTRQLTRQALHRYAAMTGGVGEVPT